jgi:tetratricopeptide (TPR) repeat protein
MDCGDQMVEDKRRKGSGRVQDIRNRLIDLDSSPETPAPEAPRAPNVHQPIGATPPPQAQQSGRFTLRALQGGGSMGQVFEAYDVVLKRRIALKLLTADSPSFVQRFLAEARAQAKVDHPNICRIYEVGIWMGRPYIAMQYVDGITLSRATGEMPLEQKVQVIGRVAEAIHEAHKQGLIHRDLKPGNVMVEKSEEGEWKPYVMDFGLARDAGARGTAMNGFVVGTPSYMAPEQARGQEQMLDRRTDVYALGATMYELLCGRPPFAGQTGPDTLKQVIHEEPLPLTSVCPGVPADLDSIVMKCMEKEPARRYQSARAVAEDLRRFLEGEPILARRANLPYRFSKFAEKHKVAIGLASIAAAGFLVLGAFYAREHWQAGERARLAQAFAEEIRATEAWMRHEHLAPLHDTIPGRALVRAKMADIRSRMARSGKLGYGPGNYALGRAFLSLGETADAERALRTAWENGYREPEVRYALGLVLAQRYREETADAEHETNREIREARRRRADEAYRKQAIEYIRSGNHAAETPEYGEAVIAYLTDDYATALRKASQASAGVIWLYEADLLQADVYATMMREARDRGDYRKAWELYEQARTAYQQAIRKGESDERTYFGLCGLGETLMVMMVYQTGEDPTRTYQEALNACRQGLEANREGTAGYQGIGALQNRWAEYLRDNGLDPGPALDEAIDWMTRGIRNHPDGRLYQTLGHSFGLKAWYELITGTDPTPSVLSGVRNFTQGLALNPRSSTACNGIGAVYWIQARYELENGIDPRPTVRLAVKNYEKAVKIDPEYAFPYSNMGNVIALQASYELIRGMDPRKSVATAVTNLERAITINPNYAYAFNNLGAVYVTRAAYELQRGLDAEPSVDKSLESLGRALSINPRFAEAYLHRAHLYCTLAGRELEDGREPASAAKAIEDLRRAVDINPNYAEAYSEMAAAYLMQAEYAQRRKGGATAHARAAVKCLERALAVNPNRADARSRMARARELARATSR